MVIEDQSISSRLPRIVLLLRAFHAEMNLLAPISSIIAGSDMKEILAKVHTE